MNTEMEQALAMLERAMSKELQDSIHEEKSIKEIQNSIDEKAEIISKLNRVTGNQWDDMEKCTSLLQRLPQIKSIDEMPAQEEIEQCIKYLIQENEMMMIGAVYSNVGGAYEEIQKNSGTSEYNEIIYQYYCWGVEATATAIKRLEREKNDKIQLEAGKKAFAYLLADISVFLYQTRQSMEIEYAKLGCEYAIEIGELKAASVIAGNFMQIYHGIERNAKKALEIGRVRIDVNKKIIDAGLDHDLKRYIEDAQNYSDVYRMELGLKNKETGQGFLYAAYYAEHSTKESRRYRDYECAINNYWYSKFAQEPINSEFWEKAHWYAKKFPFNHTCSVIVKEYRELKKGSK